MEIRYIKLMICFGLLTILLGCSTNNGTRTLKIAHGLDTNHSVHLAIEEMREKLEKISKGKMRIEIYPNQQLGSERQCLELLQLNALDMTKVSVGVLENFAPKTKVLSLPFMFRNREHAFKVLDGEIGKDLLKSTEQYWLKGLGFYDAGSRSFYTKSKAINTPDDLNGMKIRVMESVTAMDMVRNLGGSPTPISSGEIYTALQQGVVDGAENNPPTFYASRHYEICKFYSLDEHTIIPDVLLINTNKWDQLSAEEKKWLAVAAKHSIAYQRKLWLASEKEALTAVAKAGVKIIRPKKELFSEKLNILYESFRENEEVFELIKKIQNDY